MTDRVRMALEMVRGLEASWAKAWSPGEWEAYTMARAEDCEARVGDLDHEEWLDAWDDLMEDCS